MAWSSLRSRKTVLRLVPNIFARSSTAKLFPAWRVVRIRMILLILVDFIV